MRGFATLALTTLALTTLALTTLTSLAIGGGAPALAARKHKDPQAILAAIDAIVRPDAEAWCKDKGLAYPPPAIVLRIFKQERELEIWAKDDAHTTMQLLHTSPICAMDFEPGTKIAEGDGKTPEGFYHPDFLYESEFWWMWIDLDDVDAAGQVGTGSAFRMCIEYPNALDKKQSQSAGKSKPGSGICLHGNCVSIGCASFKNRDFLPVYALSRHHDGKRYGPLQLHVFPFRFDRVDAAARASLAKRYSHADIVAQELVLERWRNLELGFAAFAANPNPLRVQLKGDRYTF